MTVVTTVSPRSRPLLLRCLARMAMTKSPSTRAPRASTASTRSPSPSKARPRSKPSARTNSCSASTWVEPQPWLMLSPSGSVRSSTTSAPDSLRASGAAAEHRAVGAVDGDAQPRQVERDALDDAPDVAFDGAFDDLGATDLLALQRDQVVAADVLLDLGFFVVGELEAEVTEELDAVVGEGVVRGRHDHAGVGAALEHERGQPRRGDHPGDLNRAAAAGDAGHQRRLEHGARNARVAADQKQRAGAAVPGQHVRRPRGRPAGRARA